MESSTSSSGPTAADVPPAAPLVARPATDSDLPPADPILAVPIPAPDPPPPPPPPDPRGVREHDGFYFRFALGGGAQIGTARLEGAEATFSGGGAVVDFSIGGSARPGLALGFAVYIGVASSPSVEVRREDRGSYLESLDGHAFSTGIIGAFVDFYPDPKGGFHVEAAVGLAPLTWEMGVVDWSGASTQDWSGGGFGARLGTGYEWWISEQWSFGALARLQFGQGRLKPTENDSGPELSVTTFNPGLAAVVTYH